MNKLLEQALSKLDKNGDGKFDIQDAIILAMNVPGVHVDRSSFLRKELYKNHTEAEINMAIAKNPMTAGISVQEIDKIADEVIKFERNSVSGISALLGIPGGAAMAATIPTDVAQFYAYTLRAIQKLLYLYGFPEIDISEKEGVQLDSETMNQILICLGVMNGVAGANNAIKGMAKALAKGVEKKLLKMALTKGTLYPLIKSILKWFGVNLTKKLFAHTVGKTIPVVGSLVGGGLTYATFSPCCKRLKTTLSDTMLSNPNHRSTKEENKYADEILAGDFLEGEYIDVENH